MPRYQANGLTRFRTSGANSTAFPSQSLRYTLYCMILTEEDLHAFQKIWKKVFHEEISMEEARHIAAGVMELYSIIGQPRNQRPHSEADQQKRGNEVFPLL